MASIDPLDPDIIRRHDRPGRRYPSYPPAAQLHAGFTVGDYRRAALLSNAAPAKPLSIDVHAPFCENPCCYCGCNRTVTCERPRSADYLRHLLTEIEIQATLFDHRRQVRQLHFGEGMPTFLSIKELGRLIDALGDGFNLDRAAQREFSIEIDPRTVSEETFPGLAMLGFNRLSFGIQEFDPQVQALANRGQSATEIGERVREARINGFRSISFDLIYGWPLQTIAGFSQTLDNVIAMCPDRIAAYGYAHLPQRLIAQRALDTTPLPSAELQLQVLALTDHKLTAAGYVHIGMGHFALRNDDLAIAGCTGDLHRDLRGDSIGADCDLIGLGVSAISSVGGTCAQNFATLPAYAGALEARRLPIERGIALTMDDRVRAGVIQRLTCRRSLCFREIEQTYGIDCTSYFHEELRQLAPLQADGLVQLDVAGIRVTAKGDFLLRNIAMIFDRYLRDSRICAYSKAIQVRD